MLRKILKTIGRYLVKLGTGTSNACLLSSLASLRLIGYTDEEIRAFEKEVLDDLRSRDKSRGSDKA